LASTNLIKEEPIQPKKNPCYEKPSITWDEDNYKMLFGDD
jgi:hypothetical protein